MKLSTKLWYLNIFLSLVISAGVALLFLDHPDSTAIIATMIGIPLAAMTGEMGVYSHAVAKTHVEKERKD